MRLRHLTLALAATSLAAAPALANPAASLSVAKSTRVAAATKHDSKMVSGSATYALIGFLAVVAAVVLVTELDNDDDSN